jgi:hypothetical protein
MSLSLIKEWMPFYDFSVSLLMNSISRVKEETALTDNIFSWSARYLSTSKLLFLVSKFLISRSNFAMILSCCLIRPLSSLSAVESLL